MEERPARDTEPCLHTPICDRPITNTEDGYRHVGQDGELLPRLRWTMGIGNRMVAHSARPGPRVEGQQ